MDNTMTFLVSDMKILVEINQSCLSPSRRTDVYPSGVNFCSRRSL